MLVSLRSIVFHIGYTLATIIFGSTTIVLWALPQLVRHRVLITWCWLIVYWVQFCCGVRFRVVGAEHLASEGWPKVILSKHQSAWETFMLQGLFWPCSTILKKELLNIPFFGWGLRCLQPVAIDRSNPREALKQVKVQGLERLNSKLNLLLFPEGTRTPPGERGKYARSGADIAITAGVDIVPVAVNAGRCWPINDWRRYPGLVTVVVGEPIATAGRTSRDLIEQVENWIEAEMINLDAEAKLQ
jgi:1-acyl-sn-glycerol-3-phosphate acyltransferase